MDPYEKKYKEALEVAKRKLCFDKAGMVDSFTPNDIYEMFPELKESDDERIRKALITAVSGTFKGNTLWHTDVTREEALAWLEKQGVQPRYNIGDVICDKSCTTLNKEAQPNMEIIDIKNGMYICDKGSFPVSQQDEYELVSKKIDTKLNDDSVSNELRAASVKHAEKELKNHTFPNNEEFELVYTFEEGAKWKAAQKPTAWSEEDENIKQWIISDIDKLFCLNKKSSSLVGKEIEWLKSLKERVQPQSKQEWSEEDEGILDEIIDFLENGTVKLQHDLSLYASWLKSLKDRVGCEVNCTTTKEWSEEDEYRTEKLLGWLNTLVNYIQGDATVSLDLYRERERQIEIIKTWLKSLKALNTWKPSDEQIKALKNFTRSVVERGYFSPYDDNTKLLYSLLEDLKKLK